MAATAHAQPRHCPTTSMMLIMMKIGTGMTGGSMTETMTLQETGSQPRLLFLCKTLHSAHTKNAAEPNAVKEAGSTSRT